MKRSFVLLIATGYVLVALAGLRKEQLGALTCDCAADCWCKKPGLGLFRWVFPLGHRAET